MRARLLCLVLGCASLFIAGVARAAPCDGFVDVDDGNATYCTAVTYLKTTGITLGCSDSTHFCPNDSVTRLQMALFMQRLANNAVFRQGGNSFGLPAIVGTKDDQPLTLLAGNQPAMRLVRVAGDAVSPPSVIGGHGVNNVAAAAYGSFIGGGGRNATDCGPEGTLTCANSVTVRFGVIGGGEANTTAGDYAVIGGGHDNFGGAVSTIAGGSYNAATGLFSVVGGGDSNVSSGYASTVPGGYYNTAAGDFSVVLGYYAGTTAAAKGSFIFSDSTVSGQLTTSAPNQFLVAASGGYNLYTNKNGSTGCSIAAGGGTWACTSSHAVKRDFADIDTQDVLDKVAALPVQRWRYQNEDPAVRHLGTFAEDFRAAFGLGSDDKSITLADADGVALAAIQALYARSRADEASLREARAHAQALQDAADRKDAHIAELEQRLGRIEARLAEPR